MTALLALLRANWKPVVVLALFAAAFGAGWTVNGWRLEAAQKVALQEQIDARLKAEQDAAEKSQQLEANLAAIQQTTRDLNRKLAHETTKPDYRCALPADGVQLLREAVTGGNAPGQPDGKLP